MEDHERLGNGPNNMAGCKRSSPESPCSRSNNNNNNNNNKEQDRFLPIANVGRIMKKVIPGNGKISKDAKETVQECVSEFISFITGEASDKCQREKRKTINGDDIIWAITTLGFDEYVEPLKNYLHKYRELEGDKSAGTTPVVLVGNVLPKQQQYQDHQQNQPLLHHLPNYDPTATSSVYTPPSAASLLSQQPIPFMPTDPPFPLPFPPNSIQTTQHLAALHQQDRFDSLGPW